ncbi:TetR/AcrR family transcriptional regulator [Aeromicrobium wangtongii]|uniref:TetR/AcrR family transcriptional regulator n=1 Tax=Aeromicrobium wangtongii TaxID=2969247 RepID=A0ABY5M5I8_9ACTN|nr:TetR/AcrR family transcriptional regulator [Aeromicrobium wangtongii]MCD9199812.1 TetR/AcrR family transcriptional regulator [Aeromicrobium wangtongii]UUP13433.1 TetR/AcrR family transcriptional regulator [Aeromicrobium wangtongii]
MPRKTQRVHEQGQASRHAILDVTLRIAGERGYVGTTLGDVTRASGLSASSIYWHFHSKDELLADALEHGYRRWVAVAPRWAALDIARPRREALLQQLRAVSAGLDQEPGFWRMGLLIALETGPAVGALARDRFLQVRRAALDQLEVWWAKSLATDGPAHLDPGHAKAMALLTMVTMDGYFLAHESDRETDVEPVLRALATGLDAAAQALTAGAASSATAAPAWRTPSAPDGQETEPVDPGGREGGRLRLLQAAAEVAAESGYEGATISRICRHAGVSASSLYWHFADKDDLIGAVIEDSYRAWFAAQPAWLPVRAGASWETEVHRYLSVSLRSLTARPPFLRIGHLLLLLRRDDPPRARATFIAVRDSAEQTSTEWFTAALGPTVGAGVPAVMSRLMLLSSDGLFFSNQIDVPTWDVELFIDLVVTMLAAAQEPA